MARNSLRMSAAKLKNQKMLDDAGRFLESNAFGLAVAVGYSGMKGDSEEAQVLTQARAMVVRDYLVKNFKMDDTRFKTRGLGKQDIMDAGEGGKIEILVYAANPGGSPRSSAGLAR